MLAFYLETDIARTQRVNAMNETEEFLEDYTNQPVPKDKLIGWSGLALVIISVFISLPAYLQGIQLGQALGFYKSLMAFVTGSVILMIIGCFCGIVGARTRLSTYMITPYAFGIRGAKFVNIIVSITIFGWFGVVLAEFSEAVLASLQMLDIHFSDNLALLSAVGCFLMLVIAILGFKGLNLLANLVTPLLLFSSVMVIYLAIESVGFTAITAPRIQTMSLGNAISTVVGSMVVGMVIFPDYSRYARSTKHAVAGAVISLSLLPVVLMSASMPGLATGETELVSIVVAMGFGISALLVIIFAAWTTNSSNLYVATLSLSTVFKVQKSWYLTVICGFLGYIIAILGISDHLIPFLILLGVAIPPIGAIYVVNFFIFNSGLYTPSLLSNSSLVCYRAFTAWGLASLVAYLSANGWISLTGIASIDSIFVATFVYYCLKKFV